MSIILIAAMSENHVLGRDGRLPWRLPKDLARFKAVTMGHTVIMGRKTYESIGRDLPGRTVIVVTREPEFTAGDALIANDLPTAFRYAAAARDVFVLGGGEIYAQTIDVANVLDLTIVHTTLDGDTFFPAFDAAHWRLVKEERHEVDERHPFAFSFRRYERSLTPCGGGSDAESDGDVDHVG